jgi:hypothetical protein
MGVTVAASTPGRFVWRSVLQQGVPLVRPFDDHAAAVVGVDPPAREIQLAQFVERTCDDGFRDLQVGRKTTHRVITVQQIAGQVDAELMRRQHRVVPSHEGDDDFPQDRYGLFRSEALLHL